MNLAICIHGIIGGSNGKNGTGRVLGVKELYEHIDKRIIKPNKDEFDEINFFIHTWSTDKVDLIKEYFKPKQIKSESQKHSKHKQYSRKFSKFNSLFESIQLCKKHVNDNDIILSIRFDCAYKHEFKILKGRVKTIENNSNIFFPKDDPVWVGKHHKNRLSDYFFFGKAKNIVNIFTDENWEIVYNSMLEENELTTRCVNRYGKSLTPFLDNHTIIKSIFKHFFDVKMIIHKCKEFVSHVHVDVYRDKGDEWE